MYNILLWNLRMCKVKMGVTFFWSGKIYKQLENCEKKIFNYQRIIDAYNGFVCASVCDKAVFCFDIKQGLLLMKMILIGVLYCVFGICKRFLYDTVGTSCLTLLFFSAHYLLRA